MRNIDVLTKNVQVYLDKKSGHKSEEAREEIHDLLTLFDGSGFEDTTFINGASTANRIVIVGDYHKMNENGYYDGYASWKVIVRPDLLSGYSVSVTASNATRDDADYIGDSFHSWLSLPAPGFSEEEPKKPTMLTELYGRLIARENCIREKAEQWREKHEAFIAKFLCAMEEDTQCRDLSATLGKNQSSIEICGYKEHPMEGKRRFTVTVRPDFRIEHGFSVKVAADTAPEWKAYLADVFTVSLKSDFPGEEARPAPSA